MKRYIGKRALSGLLVVLLSVCFNFTLIRLAPGDPIRIMAGTDNPNEEMIEALQQKYGLDKSIPEQFVMFLGNVAKGDLGYSYISDESVIKLIGEKIGPTLALSLTAVLLSVTFGTLIGIYAARKNGRGLIALCAAFRMCSMQTPGFWLGLMMILIFASSLKWFPTSGMVNLRANYKGFAYFADVCRHLVLPISTMVLTQTPYYFRIARSSVLQVMSEDFHYNLQSYGHEGKPDFQQVCSAQCDSADRYSSWHVAGLSAFRFRLNRNRFRMAGGWAD